MTEGITSPASFFHGLHWDTDGGWFYMLNKKWKRTEKARATNVQPLNPRNNVATMPTGQAEQSMASVPVMAEHCVMTLKGPVDGFSALFMNAEGNRRLSGQRVCATSDYQLIFSCYEIRLVQLPCWEKQYSSFEMEGLFRRGKKKVSS